MHMPRFNWVAWIMDASSSLSANRHYTSLHLESPQIDPERDGLEPGRSDGGLHRLAPPGGRPHRDHPPSPRAAYLRRAPCGLRGGGDAVDLGAGHTGRKPLPRLPLPGHQRHDLVVTVGDESILHAARSGDDRAHRLAHALVAVGPHLDDR